MGKHGYAPHPCLPIPDLLNLPGERSDRKTEGLEVLPSGCQRHESLEASEATERPEVLRFCRPAVKDIEA